MSGLKQNVAPPNALQVIWTTTNSLRSLYVFDATRNFSDGLPTGLQPSAKATNNETWVNGLQEGHITLFYPLWRGQAHYGIWNTLHCWEMLVWPSKTTTNIDKCTSPLLFMFTVPLTIDTMQMQMLTSKIANTCHSILHLTPKEMTWKIYTWRSRCIERGFKPLLVSRRATKFVCFDETFNKKNSDLCWMQQVKFASMLISNQTECRRKYNLFRRSCLQRWTCDAPLQLEICTCWKYFWAFGAFPRAKGLVYYNLDVMSLFLDFQQVPASYKRMYLYYSGKMPD